jgi:alkylation response protein AidB-like acyl-CoA dehydrogenase
MIELFGTDQQKELFLKKLYAGTWGGSMLLTEPQAGSDVGALTTAAVKNEDGTYSITGNKIFITNGDQDLTPNIIHPVLARVEGAPAGTAGISLFIVPKIWVNPDGSLGAPNDVVCTGIEEKMGLHASPTCSLTLGGKGRCRGLLLGEENQGMAIMFHMMNEARLDVGRQGFCHGSTAYLYALAYARDRLQGRDLAAGKNPQAPQVAIIRHPDVRRMLLEMKAKVDGMRSFIYYVALCFDHACCATDERVRLKYKGLTELLTPLVKAYCSERGMEICDQAVQVYGGYGYTRDYPVEQLMRDCKITTIYEGTNGIQAMDLLGRKLRMDGGASFKALLSEIGQVVAQAHDLASTAGLAERVEKATQHLSEVAEGLIKQLESTAFQTAFAYAHPFLTVMGDVVMSWMHLWRAVVATPRLESLLAKAGHDDLSKLVAQNKDAAFYDGMLKTASYYIETVLPVTLGRMEAITGGNSAAVTIDERSFGG